MFFPQRLRKLSVSFYSMLIIALLFSSCTSSKSTSLAYMDDIYNTTFPDVKGIASLDEEMIEEEDGIPPENVPGAAYVYQPIAEPNIEEPTNQWNNYYPNTYYSGYFGADFYNPYYSGIGSPFISDFYSPYLTTNFGMYPSISLGWGYFSFGYSWGSNYYYPGGGGYSCPSSTSSGVSSSAFVAKRFSWNDNPEQSIEYINKAANSTKGINNNVRSSKGRKSTYVNSNTSESTSTKSSNKWKNFFDTISNGVQEGNSSNSTNSTTRSRSTESGSSYGTRSSGSTRSSGTRSGSSGSSSGTTRTGKRIR